MTTPFSPNAATFAWTSFGDTDRIATGQGLSDVAYDVVCGTVLGDGHLNRASSHLFFAHSGSQSEYAQYKADALAELEPRIQYLQVAAVSGGAAAYPVVHVRTRADRALRGAASASSMVSGSVCPGGSGRRSTTRMLAIWFMDDGYTRIREGGRQAVAEIATDGFDDADFRC